MAMIPQQDPDAEMHTTPAQPKRAPMKMKTPGMGAMMGAPRTRGLSPMGKVTPGALPFESQAAPAAMAKGGKVGGASKRADGCVQRGKTKGRMI